MPNNNYLLRYYLNVNMLRFMADSFNDLCKYLFLQKICFTLFVSYFFMVSSTKNIETVMT